VRPAALLREEGGDVATGQLTDGLFAGIRGTVADSAGRPLAGALVRVAGTRHAASTGARGDFVIDSVPVGNQQLVVGTPGYDSLGMAAIDASVAVRIGGNRPVTLRALNARALYSRMCLGRPATRYYGAIRVSVRSASGDSIVRGLPMTILWMTRRGAGSAADTVPRSIEMRSDDRGSAVACELPAGTPVRIIVGKPEGGVLPAIEVVLPSAGVKGLIVRMPEAGPRD
jgi:hypothetical protein